MRRFYTFFVHLLQLIFKHKVFVFSMFFSLLCRLLYFAIYPYYVVFEDSEGYYTFAMTVTRFPLAIENFVSVFRTPVYPLFLGIILRSAGVTNPNFETSTVFVDGVWRMMLVQTFIGLVSLFVLYVTLRKLSILQGVAGYIVFLLGINPSIFLWEKAMMTESLATFWLALLGYGFVSFALFGKLRHALMLGLLLSIGYLLRPAFMLMPYGILVFLFFLQRKKFIRFILISLVVYCVIVPMVYAYLNAQYKKFDGFGWGTGIGMIAKILQYNLDTSAGKKYTRIYPLLENWKLQTTSANTYKFLEAYDYMDAAAWKEMEDYGKTVILANIPQFILYSIMDIPKVFFEHKNFIERFSVGMGPMHVFLYRLYDVFAYMRMLLIFTIPLSIVHFVSWIRKRSHTDGAILLFAISGLTQVFMVSFYSASYDYGMLERFAHLAQIHLYIYLCIMIYKTYAYLRIGRFQH